MNEARAVRLHWTDLGAISILHSACTSSMVMDDADLCSFTNGFQRCVRSSQCGARKQPSKASTNSVVQTTGPRVLAPLIYDRGQQFTELNSYVSPFRSADRISQCLAAWLLQQSSKVRVSVFGQVWTECVCEWPRILSSVGQEETVQLLEISSSFWVMWQ